MALWTIEKCVIMGVCRSWEGKFVFARAPLLLGKFDENKLLRVTRYPDNDYVEGEQLSFAEVDALVAQGEALRFEDPIPLKRAGIVCWILRLDSYPQPVRPDWIFADLIYNDALLTAPIRGPKPFTFALMVDEEKANHLRDTWASQEENRAGDLADCKNWLEAAKHAERAFIISTKSFPEISATVVFYLEKAGNLERSSGFLQMLKNSNDVDFMAKVVLHLEKLREMYK